MLYLGALHIEMVLSVIGFVAGMAILMTNKIDTQAFCRAFPILIGMAGWLLILILGTSALYNTSVVGIKGINHNDCLYAVYKAIFLYIWFLYLRRVSMRFRKGYFHARKSS